MMVEILSDRCVYMWVNQVWKMLCLACCSACARLILLAWQGWQARLWDKSIVVAGMFRQPDGRERASQALSRYLICSPQPRVCTRLLNRKWMGKILLSQPILLFSILW